MLLEKTIATANRLREKTLKERSMIGQTKSVKRVNDMGSLYKSDADVVDTKAVPTLNETKTIFEGIMVDGKSIMDHLQSTMGNEAIGWIDDLVNMASASHTKGALLN